VKVVHLRAAVLARATEIALILRVLLVGDDAGNGVARHVRLGRTVEI
jgi:hypothetical protein